MNNEELKHVVQEEITDCMEQILDYSQVAVADAHWKQLRSKILRSGNNSIRNLCAYINENMND
jgi:hypothetical protein